MRPGWRLVALNGEELDEELAELQGRLKAPEQRSASVFLLVGTCAVWKPRVQGI